jgi:hypothetical protein
MIHLRSRPVHLLSLLALLLTPLLGACGSGGDYRPSATGREGEIIVVMDSMLWRGPVGEAAREQLGPWLGTCTMPRPIAPVPITPMQRSARLASKAIVNLY